MNESVYTIYRWHISHHISSFVISCRCHLWHDFYWRSWIMLNSIFSNVFWGCTFWKWNVIIANRNDTLCITISHHKHTIYLYFHKSSFLIYHSRSLITWLLRNLRDPSRSSQTNILSSMKWFISIRFRWHNRSRLSQCKMGGWNSDWFENRIMMDSILLKISFPWLCFFMSCTM